jgi:hypothetical protein
MSAPARVRLLPRHRETPDSFSVLSDVDTTECAEEWIFAIVRGPSPRSEVRRLRVERIEVRAFRNGAWRLFPDAEVSETSMPAEVLLRAANKLRAFTKGAR